MIVASSRATVAEPMTRPMPTAWETQGMLAWLLGCFGCAGACLTVGDQSLALHVASAGSASLTATGYRFESSQHQGASLPSHAKAPRAAHQVRSCLLQLAPFVHWHRCADGWAMKLRRIKARAYRQKPKRDPWAEWSEWSHRQIIRLRVEQKNHLVSIDAHETWNIEPLRSLDWWRANSPSAWRMDPSI